MSDANNPKTTVAGKKTAYWKARYDRQALVVDSMTSLLSKYGSLLELDKLYREFLLTLMGQFLVESSCYFQLTDDGRAYAMAAHYGGGCADDAPVFEVGHPLIEHLQSAAGPVRTCGLPPRLAEDGASGTLTQMTSLLAPLRMREKMIGVLGLGQRIGGKPYADADLEIIRTLCAVSGVSFSNARSFENARVSMKEIQSLYDLRTEMISRVTHEFRTPLTIITAGLQIMKVSEGTMPIRDSVSTAVSDLERLIESLLELRSDAQRPPKDQRFHPGRGITELLPQVRAAGEKEITFAVSDRVQAPVVCRGLGRESFLAIVSVVIDNAVKFSECESRVHIGLSVESSFGAEGPDAVRLEAWHEQNRRTLTEYGAFDERVPEDAAVAREASPCMVIRVQDWGIGIPSAEMRYLGEPFRQASNSPDQKIKGRALGLAVVMKTLTECGGELWCESEVGVGTTFSIYLPLAD